MGNGKLTEHAQNLQGCEKCNLRKAVGNLELPHGHETTATMQEGPYKVLFSDIPSDLMKSTVVDESLSSMNLQFCSRENQLLQYTTTE